MPPPDERNGPHASTGRRQPPQTTTATIARGGDGVRAQIGLPWTADPSLRWDTGQAAAVLAAVGILNEVLATDLDPAYWRLLVGHALEALGAAVTP